MRTGLNGKAAQDAARQIRQRLAALFVATPPTQATITTAALRSADGEVTAGAHRITFDALVAQAYTARVQLWSDGFYATPGLH